MNKPHFKGRLLKGGEIIWCLLPRRGAKKPLWIGRSLRAASRGMLFNMLRERT